MDNPENTIVVKDNEVNPHKTPESETSVPVAGIELPAPQAGKQPRNQHLKVAEPKDKQFAARATATQHAEITAAMQANGCKDIVELMLFSMRLHRKDFLTPFKF